MLVSVIVCTYSEKFIKYLEKAIASLLEQDYQNLEIVIVVDGNTDLLETIQSKLLPDWKMNYPDRKIILTGHKENRGLSYSRNQGIKKANGDILAFFDDDAVADKRWISILAEAHGNQDIVAAGGRLLPIWESGDPGFIPEECYWLIGATYRGFQEEAGFVRNTFGSNMSFSKEVFQEIGDFEESLGRVGDRLLQGEETELAMRMEAQLGKGVYYDPNAIVHHHVLEARLDLGWLFRRSFEQGVSKSQLKNIVREYGYSQNDDSGFLGHLLFKGIPNNLGHPPKLVFLLACVSLVGAGYLKHRVFGR